MITLETLTLDTAWIRDLSAHGAIVLGYLVRRCEDADADGWFTATADDFRQVTGIQWVTYLYWRRHLESQGILETETPLSGANRYRLHLSWLDQESNE